MKLDFWHERWDKNQIGFHQSDFNRYMLKYLEHLGVSPGANILVPLCGKSLDMIWLANQGLHVTGIEISPVAVKTFFRENKLGYQVLEIPEGRLYRSKNISIYCADFFQVEFDHTPPVDAVFDRASLIALPAEMRHGYAERLTHLINNGTRVLLVTLDYVQSQMSGPPFSVTPQEVQHLFADNFDIDRLHTIDILENEPHFKSKGLTGLDEHVFLMQKR